MHWNTKMKTVRHVGRLVPTCYNAWRSCWWYEI